MIPSFDPCSLLSATPASLPALTQDDVHALLVEACSHANVVTVQRYLNQGATPYSQNPLGHVAWQVAFQRDQKTLLPLMLAAGLNPNEVHNHQPLLLASMINGSLSLIDDLLGRGVDPHQQDVLGRGIVYLAVYNPDLNVLRRALQHAPEQVHERVGRQQDTALHQVAYDSRDAEDAARLLLDAGVDPTVRNLDGCTAMDIARREGHFHTLAVIEGAMLHDVARNDATPGRARPRL